jgi:hypothetical protein
MTCGIADVLEIVVLASRAQATLNVRGANVAALIGAEKDILELHHTAVGKQQRRVVGGDQRRRRNDGVPFRREVLEKGAADVVCFHVALWLMWGRARSSKRAIESF